MTRSGPGSPKQFSWNNKASVLYLDQPTGSGYSHGSKVTGTMAAAKDVSAFLTLFLQKYPAYSKQPLHIHGVSYGGHTVPAIAAEILSHDKQTINLKSISIANGWVDPATQYKSLPAMACGEGSGYPTALTNEQCQVMREASLDCEKRLAKAYNSSNIDDRVAATLFCNKNLLDYFERTAKRTVYDIRINGTATGIWDEELMKTLPNFPFYTFLSQPAVRKAIGAGETPFSGLFNMQVFRDFVDAGDFGESFAHLLPSVLEKIPVLLYNGDADYACNWLGTKAWTDSLKWTGQNEYKGNKMLPWNVAGKQLGEYKTAQGLSFVRLFGIGHTAAKIDQAAVVLDLLNSFLQKGDKFAV
ncbi:hypothetical protein TWF696_002946 [Orbilia brochopaga]|uniref:carboxypeptidase C n=1 Tax=Orbilia brochopaga TaxID=3140254 RepID=A0AAV9TZ75_9PEZI